MNGYVAHVAVWMVVLTIVGTLLSRGHATSDNVSIATTDATTTTTVVGFIGFLTSTTLPCFFCEHEVRLYDPVELTRLVVKPAYPCEGAIPGVTAVVDPFTQNVVVEGFPPGFRGPAVILKCPEIYHHSEAPPQLSDEPFREIVEARGADGDLMPSPAFCISRVDCDETQPGPFVAAICGDATADEMLSVTDALAVLVAATAGGPCPLARCDIDRSGSTTATDALGVLRYVVGLEQALLCPAPCAPLA